MIRLGQMIETDSYEARAASHTGFVFGFLIGVATPILIVMILANIV